jgi:hypothetical protein
MWTDLITAHIGATKEPKFFKSALIDYEMGDRRSSPDSYKDFVSFVVSKDLGSTDCQPFSFLSMG